MIMHSVLFSHVKYKSGLQDVRDGEAYDHSNGDETYSRSGAINLVALSAAATNEADKASAGPAPHNAPHCRRRYHKDFSRVREES